MSMVRDLWLFLEGSAESLFFFSSLGAEEKLVGEFCACKHSGNCEVEMQRVLSDQQDLWQ